MPLNNNSSLKATIDGFENLKNVVNNNRITLRDILEDKNVEVSENERLSSLIGKVNSIKWGGVDIISATSLPASVKDRQLVVITDTPMTDTVFHNIQPTIGAGIKEGGVWINTTNNTNVFEYIVAEFPKYSFYVLDCYQVVNGTYVKKNVYCGISGVWQHVNPSLYYIQEFVNDKPLTYVDASATPVYNEGNGCQRITYNTNGGNHTVGGKWKTKKQINTTGFTKAIFRFSVTHISDTTFYLMYKSNNAIAKYKAGTSSANTIHTWELDIADVNDICYIQIYAHSSNNVNGIYVIDLYDVYLTN